MRLKVLSQTYKKKCPVCEHELLIIVLAGHIRGEERCRNCLSVIEWDLSDELEKLARER